MFSNFPCVCFSRSVLLSFHTLVTFPVFLLLYILTFILLWLEGILCIISTLKICWDLIYGLTCDLSRGMSHVHLKRTSLLLSLGRLFCISFLSSWFIMLLKSFASFIFLMSDWWVSYWKWGLEVANHYCKTLYSPFHSINFFASCILRFCYQVHKCL